MESINEQSVNTQEVAAPEEQNMETVETGSRGDRTQSAEDNRRFAAARRAAEAEFQRKMDAERRHYQMEMDAFAKMRGFDTWDEMKAESSNEVLANAGITPEALAPLLTKAISEHPAVRTALEVTEQATVDKALKEFVDEFPEAGVRTIEDFVNIPHYDQFYDFVGRGLSFKEAYLLSNQDAVMQKKTNAAKQAVLNKANSKEHMQPMQGGNDVAIISVPKETMRMYKQFFPEWSEKKIRDHYAESIEKG